MNKRILTILLVFVLILGVGIVSAENLEIDGTVEPTQAIDTDIQEYDNENVQTTDHEIKSVKDNDEVLSASSEEEVLGDIVYSDTGGVTVDFNGYRSYCINRSADPAGINMPYATEYPAFEDVNTNEDISNYIKWIFYLYTDLALSQDSADKNIIQEAIWAFTDGNYLTYSTSNEQVQNIVDNVKQQASERNLRDYAEKEINSETKLVYYFRMFIPLTENGNYQSYIGFMVNERPNLDNDKIEEFDQPIEPDKPTNETKNNNTETTNTTNKTTPIENTTNETTPVENTTPEEQVDNEIEDIPEEEVQENSTAPVEKETPKTITQSISNATGNPLAILIAILAILGIYPNLRRKD